MDTLYVCFFVVVLPVGELSLEWIKSDMDFKNFKNQNFSHILDFENFSCKFLLLRLEIWTIPESLSRLGSRG